MKKIYYNLTNGIEFSNKKSLFIRIQSSLCEAKKWDKILNDLDYNFLMDLAMGHEIIIIDSSQKKIKPRAIYQGIPWIKYALTRRWYNRIELVFVKRNNVSNYFNKEYHSLSKETKRKLDYFRKFLFHDEIKIRGIGLQTKKDGNYNFYKNKLLLCKN